MIFYFFCFNRFINLPYTFHLTKQKLTGVIFCTLTTENDPFF